MIRTVLPAEVADVVALHARARATYCPDGLPQGGTDWLASWESALARPEGRVPEPAGPGDHHLTMRLPLTTE